MHFVPIIDDRVHLIEKLSDNQRLALFDYLCSYLLCPEEDCIEEHDDVTVEVLKELMCDDVKIIHDDIFGK